jgi:hypothetical protein
MRVYPYLMGSIVRADSTGTTLSVENNSAIRGGDYIMICSAVSYGDTELFIPDTGRIAQVTSVNAAARQLALGNPLTVVQGEHVLNLGIDSSLTPLSAPNYDGGANETTKPRLKLYTDPSQTTENANPYMVTGQGGWYRGWTSSGVHMVDLLITNGSGVPQAVKPYVTVGHELDEPYYNVRDYGATGDGTTDDSFAFDFAIEQCKLDGGGIIHMPAGTYIIGAGKQVLLDGDDIILQGVGDASILSATTSDTTIPIVVTGDRCVLRDFKGIGNSGQASEASTIGIQSSAINATVERLTVDLSGALGILIQGQASKVTVKNCRISNAKVGGVQASGGAKDCKILDNHITDPVTGGGTAGAGVVVFGHTNSTNNILVRGNTVLDSLGAGIRVQGVGGILPTDIQILGNHVDHGTAAAVDEGIVINATEVICSNNRVNGSYTAGILVWDACENVDILGNIISNVSQVGAGLHGGISCWANGGSPINVTIKDNIVYDDQATETTHCAVHFADPLAGDFEGFVVEGNTSRNCTITPPVFFHANIILTDKEGIWVGVNHGWDTSAGNVRAYAHDVRTLAASSTPSVRNAKYCKLSTTTPISDFNDGTVGQVLYLFGSATGNTLTNGPSLILDGGADVVLSVGDIVMLIMLTDQVWHQVAKFSDNN